MGEKKLDNYNKSNNRSNSESCDHILLFLCSFLSEYINDELNNTNNQSVTPEEVQEYRRKFSDIREVVYKESSEIVEDILNDRKNRSNECILKEQTNLPQNDNELIIVS